MKFRFLAAALLMFAVVDCSAKPVLLKMKWVSGDQHVTEVQIVQEQSTKMAALPQPMKQTTKQTIRTRTTVMPKTSDGGNIVEMDFTSVAMDTEMNGVKMSFDSSSDPSADAGNPMAPIMRGMVASKFKYHMDSNGKVQKVTGIDQFVDNISQGNPMMKSMMSQMINEDSMKEMSGGSMDSSYLPDNPVDVGKTWTDEQVASLGPLGKTSVVSKYLFKGWETKNNTKCAVITFTGTVKTVAGEKGKEMMMGVSIDSVDGVLSGKILFDPEKGMPLVSEMSQKMEMSMTMPQQGTAEAQKMETSINQTIVSTLIQEK